MKQSMYLGDEYEIFGTEKVDAASKLAGEIPTGSCESGEFQQKMKNRTEKLLQILTKNPNLKITEWQKVYPSCSGSSSIRMTIES